jgi:ABC-2 type transport system permease protein
VRAFLRFLGKEGAEITRTWRLWVVGGVLLFLAVLSPVTAKAIPSLMKYASGGGSGIAITITRQVSYVDSYDQWIKNLSQIGMMLVIFASAGLIATERAAGTAALVVTKPVSRSSFVVAKYVAQALLVAVATLAGAIIVLVGTQLAFGDAPPARLLAASGAWLSLALLSVAGAEVLSAILPTIAAAISAVLVWGLSGIAGLWQPALDYSPVGLLGAPAAILAGKHVDLAWPLATTTVATVLLVALAAALFSTREL